MPTFTLILFFFFNSFGVLFMFLISCVTRPAKLKKENLTNVLELKKSKQTKGLDELKTAEAEKNFANFLNRFNLQCPFKRKANNHRLLCTARKSNTQNIGFKKIWSSLPSLKSCNVLNENSKVHRFVLSSEVINEKLSPISVENSLYFSKTLRNEIETASMRDANDNRPIEGEVFIPFKETSGPDFQSDDSLPWLHTEYMLEVLEERKMIFQKYTQAKYYCKLQRCKLGLPSRTNSSSTDYLTSPKTPSYVDSIYTNDKECTACVCADSCSGCKSFYLSQKDLQVAQKNGERKVIS